MKTTATLYDKILRAAWNLRIDKEKICTDTQLFAGLHATIEIGDTAYFPIAKMPIPYNTLVARDWPFTPVEIEKDGIAPKGYQREQVSGHAFYLPRESAKLLDLFCFGDATDRFCSYLQLLEQAIRETPKESPNFQALVQILRETPSSFGVAEIGRPILVEFSWYAQTQARLDTLLNAPGVNNLLLVGEPGSGKSTFVQKFCQESPRSYQTLCGEVPVIHYEASAVMEKGRLVQTLRWLSRRFPKTQPTQAVLVIDHVEILWDTIGSSTQLASHLTSLSQRANVKLLLVSSTAPSAEISSQLELAQVTAGLTTEQDLRALLETYRGMWDAWFKVTLPRRIYGQALGYAAALQGGRLKNLVRLLGVLLSVASKEAAIAGLPIAATITQDKHLVASVKDTSPMDFISAVIHARCRLRQDGGFCARDINTECTPDMLHVAMNILSGAGESHIDPDVERLADKLNDTILGQQEAVATLHKALRRREWGLNSGATRGNYLFVGATGVGKTELALQLTQQFFGDSEKLIRFDMSEFAESHTLSRLLGSPPGYVGSNTPGLLCTQIKQAGSGVLLFDEVEKAHPRVLGVLLQMMDAGKISDNTLQSADCKDFFIILTSNVGIHELSQTASLGFKPEEQVSAGNIMKKIKNHFTPELLNRLEIVMFNNITPEVCQELSQRLLDTECDKFRKQRIEVTFTDAVYAYIADKGFSKDYGVRFLRSKIQQLFTDPVLDEIISNGHSLDSGNVAYVSVTTQETAEGTELCYEVTHIEDAVRFVADPDWKFELPEVEKI